MRIIKYSQSNNNVTNIVDTFPDQYVSEKTKNTDDWIRVNNDFFANIAHQHFGANNIPMSKNYQLMKGIISRADFGEDPSVQSFTDILTRDIPLPSYIKHYPIINPPINTMMGEISKRPDNHRVKAFDDDSRNQELAQKTEFLQDFIMQEARQRIMMKVAQQQGMTPEDIMNDEEMSKQVQGMTEKEISDYMVSYTSLAESWSNHTIEALKMEFSMKEKSEEAFKDLLTISREFYEIYEDNSKTGFNVRVLNPVNVFQLTTPNKKYTKDSYLVGTIELMELGEIIDTFPNLTKEVIDHLKEGVKGYELNKVRKSNLFTSATGNNSVTYDTYDPALVQEKMLLESQLNQNNNALQNYLGVNGDSGSFGSKFVVVKSYWKSRKKQGKLTYLDPQTGTPITTIVDETYKTIPEEISIEWGYITQWWQGLKIGDDVYDARPFTLLDYSPIIGVVHENKNTDARSLIDLMKPFQILYNICMNQLFELLNKEIGNVARVSLRRIPRLKDGDDQDAIDQWELQAKEMGIMFDDDSPENTNGGVSNQTVIGSVDLTRSAEIQSRYNLAVQLKNECWELVGFTRQRLGSTLATETATSVNAGLTQSYAQTEPYFVQHDYVLNQLYQGILDAAQFIESNKPQSTVSYINNDGEAKFIQINGADLKMKDLKVFVTSRAEDQRIFQELRNLSQAMLQNGASIYDVAVLYSTNSVRQMKDTFKRLKEHQEEIQQQQQQMEQQQLEQQQQQFEQQQVKLEQMEQQRMLNENYQKELDRLNKKEVAIINSFSRQDDNLKDTNMNGNPDLIEYSKLSVDQQKAQQDYTREMAKMQNETKKHQDEMKLKLEDINLQKEKLKQDKELKEKEMVNNLTIAKYRDKGTKNSPKKK